MGISKEELDWAVTHWTTANYLAAASIYLKDNFFLEKPLKPEHIKDRLLGHWGTCPGINFVYTYLNLLASKKDQNTLLIVGPGHGFPAILSNMFIDGSLQRYYPVLTNSEHGISSLIKSFSWPGGFPSHANPGTPGTIHEGGELGYALSTAFGAAFDNPDLLVAVIVGDGEAETGPTATAWHSNKFLNPKKDGVVLPILHLNGYKINSPTIYGTMSDKELTSLFIGYGYDPIFVGEDHKEMAQAMFDAYQRIKQIKKELPEKPQWPIIILKTRKGWTGVKELEGNPVEGSYRSHQVPLKDVKKDKSQLQSLEKWLRSYHPEKLFSNHKLPSNIKKHIPKNPIGNNKHALGGNIRKPLKLSNGKDFAVNFKYRGDETASATKTLGIYLKEVISNNRHNFLIFSPDELSSNKLDAVFDVTGRKYVWPHPQQDKTLHKDGRVLEMLSEHTLQGWMQGYILTGRHGLFPGYEAFMPIVDSMVSQYLKFIEASQNYSWRKPVSSINYLLTSTCWRQEHNGFSHQNPGFINMLLNKESEEDLVRFYFPADTNMLLVQAQHALQSTNRVNLFISDKQMMRQWLTYDEALQQSKTGAAVWKFASDETPDIVFATCGDYQTQEGLATIKLLKRLVPEIKIRFVNVSELNVLGHHEEYPNGLQPDLFDSLFTKDKEVVFTFHGYHDTIKQLLFERDVGNRFSIFGYKEAGSTTTPFDMLVRNGVSRYQLAQELVERAVFNNPKLKEKASIVISYCKEKLKEHSQYITKYGNDMEEVNGWTW